MKRQLTMLNIFTLLLASLLLASLPVRAQEIGILFTSPEEREYLDLLREDFLARNAAANFDIDVAEPPPIILQEEETGEPETTYFHLGAIISSADGRNTLWLNGLPIEESELPANMSLIKQNSSFALLIRTENGNLVLKPGQSINTETRTLQENSGSALPSEGTSLSSESSFSTDIEESLPADEEVSLPAVSENSPYSEISVEELLLELDLNPNDPDIAEALQFLLRAETKKK